MNNKWMLQPSSIVTEINTVTVNNITTNISYHLINSDKMFHRIVLMKQDA